MADNGLNQLTMTEALNASRGALGYKRLATAISHVADKASAGSGATTTVAAWSKTTGAELATNGAFTTDASWTKGTGWTIGPESYTASDGTQAADADLTQDISAVPSSIYQTVFTVAAYSAGNVTMVIGDQEGTDRASNATFTEYITCGAGTDIDIRADADFVGRVDTVTAKLATPGSDLVTNGAMAADTDWTKGTGWTIAAGVASSDGTQVADSDLTQDITAVTSSIYQVVFTVSGYSAGNVTAVVGDTEGTDRAANGTFTEYIIAGAGTDIDIRADLDFVGNIDNVTVKLVTLGADLVVNGGMTTDATWTKGTGWTIVGGAASDGTQGADADLTQNVTAVTSTDYNVNFKVTARSAGVVTPVVGDTEGTDRSTVATFDETITAGAGTDIDIRASSTFVGVVDDVSIKVAAVYAIGDYASNGGSDYICILAHSGSAATEPGVGGSWSTNWKLLILYTDVAEFIEIVALNGNTVYAGTCVASIGDIPLVDDRILEGESHRGRFTTVDIKTGVALGYYI